MANTITLVNAFDNLQYTFDILNAPEGIPAQQRRLTEALRTRGVNGTVYREIGKQYVPFLLIGRRSFATFAAAKAEIEFMELMQGNFFNLSHDIHGTHNGLFCLNIEAVPVAGELVGPGITPGGQAYVRSTISVTYA